MHAFGQERRRWLSLTVAAVVSAAMVVTAGPARAASCAGAADGGDWPSYGHDLRNSRTQDQERTIDAANAGDLEVGWTFAARPAGIAGGFQSTPVVANGCLYAATSSGGNIVALNADTGEPVWHTNLAEAGVANPSGIYALSVMDGRVHAQLSAGSETRYPIAVALDAQTGDLLWQSDPIEFGYRAGVTASAVTFAGKQLVASTGPDSDLNARPGIGIVDAGTGEILAKHTITPPSYFEHGYAGAGIWATPVVDLESGYAFAGTAQPYSKKVESEYDNAIVKIDVDKTRPTFGQTVDVYKGNVDQYFPGLDRQPACEAFGNEPALQYGPGFSLACVQLDVDFGGSPTMFRNSRGQLLVGEMQKSGVFHVVFADRMAEAWTALVSYPTAAGNAASSASDGTNVYVVANPGLLWALNPDNGAVRWVAPIADGADYHPPTVANGVVYLLGNHGTVVGYDAATGIPVAAKNLTLDTKDACAPLGAGIAMARNTLYVACDSGAQSGGWIVAYTL